jgi:hypothetical protein
MTYDPKAFRLDGEVAVVTGCWGGSEELVEGHAQDGGVAPAGLEAGEHRAIQLDHLPGAEPVDAQQQAQAAQQGRMDQFKKGSAPAWRGKATRRSDRADIKQRNNGARPGTCDAPLDYRCCGFPLPLADDIATHEPGRFHDPAMGAESREA